MASRTITGSLPSHPRSMVRWTQLARFVSTTETTLVAEYSARTNDSGAFSLALPVPSTGTVPYRIDLPDGLAADVFIGAGAATTLEALLGGTGTGALRTITGSLPSHPRSTVRFRQQAALIPASGMYLTREYSAITDAFGAFSIAVPTWSVACVPYQIHFPDGSRVDLCLESGAATTLEALLGGGVVTVTGGYRSPLWPLGIGAP